MKMMANLLKTSLIYENIWQIAGPANDLMYVVLGKEKAMLVDTGLGIGNLRKIVAELTSLPFMVVNTHGHPDHAGGNGNFTQAWLNAKDMSIMETMCADDYRSDDIKRSSQAVGTDPTPFLREMVAYRKIEILPYHEGSTFDLGGRKFTAIEIPGHTPGSMALYESNEKLLFAGDSVVTTPAWLYLKHSMPLQIYYNALLHLRDVTAGVEYIFTGHLPTLASPDLLDDLAACAKEIIQTPGIGEKTITFAGQGISWSHGQGQIIYDPNNITAQ